MPVKLYGLKNCDSCKKSLKALQAAGETVTFHDVRADGMTKSQLTKWARAADWEKLLNTRSTTWRGLDAAEKENVTQMTAIDLMATHPTLIKRPIIEKDGAIYVGWGKEVQNEILS